MSVQDYQAWIVAQKARIQAANKAAAADRDKFTVGGSTTTPTTPAETPAPAAPTTDAGKAVFASAGCGACHTRGGRRDRQDRP